LIKKRRTKRKKGPGYPPFQPTTEQRNQVEKLVGFGLVQDDIRQLILNPYSNKPISRPTLRANFKRELTVGTIKTNANVVQSLYQNCLKGNPTCQIWWTKTRMGWKETVRAEVAGKSGGPIKLDLSGWSDEQFAAAEAALEVLDRLQKSAAGGAISGGRPDRKALTGR
jgi:hypothetical protein